MTTRCRSVRFGLLGAMALMAVACGRSGDSSGSSAPGDSSRPASTTGRIAGPTPEAMCTTGSVALAAYDLSNGSFEWAVCRSSDARRDVVAATDDFVYLREDFQDVIAFDVGDGTERSDAPRPVDEQLLGTCDPEPDLLSDLTGPVTDGVCLLGGQDDPLAAVDASSGATLWTHPGSPVYDDVWAVTDGAVFVIDTASLVAYELTSGATRWSVPAGAFWPWYATDHRLFAMWRNLAVISTSDGSTIWRTDYPDAEFPRMTGVRANSDTVFVAFSSVASGGD